MSHIRDTHGGQQHDGRRPCGVHYTILTDQLGSCERPDGLLLVIDVSLSHCQHVVLAWSSTANSSALIANQTDRRNCSTPLR